jgi:hypothetical protein
VVGIGCVVDQVDLDPADPSGVGADVGRLVGGEDQRLGRIDTPLADLLTVDVERDGPALGEPAPS